MATPQSYQNHIRWYPFVHFVIVPMMLINLVYQIIRLVQDSSWDHGFAVFFAVAVTMLVPASRLQTLKVQDRVIRLEEKLRYRDLLPEEKAVRAAKLRRGQMLALRFASDDEINAILDRILAGELKEPKDIKQAIRNWRADHLRA